MVIQALVKRGVYLCDIARDLGVHPRTVRRAIERGAAPSRQRQRRGSLPPLASSVGRAIRFCLSRRIKPTLSNLLGVIKEALPDGLGPWEQKLATLLSSDGRSNSFRSLERELLVPPYDLDTGDRVVFGIGDPEDPSISIAVAASSALPTLFQPVRIGNRDLIGGGIGKVAHLDLALERGATTIFILNPIVPVRNDRQSVCIPSLDGTCSNLRVRVFSISQARVAGSTCASGPPQLLT